MEYEPEKIPWWTQLLIYAGVAVALPACWPLWVSGVIRDKIESRWPESRLAAEWSFYIGLFLPPALILIELVVLFVFLRVVLLRLRAHN